MVKNEMRGFLIKLSNLQIFQGVSESGMLINEARKAEFNENY